LEDYPLPAQRPPAIVNPQLASAMTHPTRIRTLRVLTEREATPREIAAEIDEPLNNVAYHIKVLKKLGCIELVRVDQAHGGRVAEHVYKGSQRPYWDQADLEQLDEAGKLNVVYGILQHVSEDVATSMAHGTFFEHDDNHLSRMPMVVDQDGWDEVIELLDGTLDELMAIQERVNERGADGADTKLAKVAILQFESPPPKTV
jgi:DNA-binding transcriptional ArsR family regulator